MSEPINDGGPAFPFTFEEVKHGLAKDDIEVIVCKGISVRDWFAGQALAGDMASQSEGTGEWNKEQFPKLASRCYAIADAMLKERAK